MPSDVVEVASYADLVSDDGLELQAADAIARALVQDDAGAVVWTEAWLAAEKDIAPVDGAGQVFQGSIEAETEKAWLLAVDGAEAWIPKSQARRFRATDGAEIAVPQSELDAYERGELA